MALARARPIQSLVATLVFSKVTLPVDLRSVISTVSTFIRSRLTTWLPHLKLKALQATARPSRVSWVLVLLTRSEEHTSELQSPCNLVCRLLLEKKKYNTSPIWLACCSSTAVSEHALCTITI